MLVVLLTLLILFPANWLASWIAQRSDGRIILADAQGTLWRGSAVLGFAEPGNGPLANRALALPGRVEWQVNPIFRSSPESSVPGLAIWLQHDGVLTQPLQLQLGMSSFSVSSGQANLPLALSRLAGAPMNTLRLQGSAQLQWNHFTISSGKATPGDVAAGTIQLIDVSSAINAAIASVRPLGTYRMNWQADSLGRLQYQVLTVNGPLMIDGQGSSAAGFSGRAMIAPGTPVITVQRLQPLLNVLGRRANDAGNEQTVTIRIGS